MLLLLDMSAAFDAVHHSILLSRLSTSFGINGKAPAWFRSYLHNRSQFISIDSYRSTNRPLTCGLYTGPDFILDVCISYWVHNAPSRRFLSHICG